MSIFLESSERKNIYLGDTQIQKVYLGTTQVYSSLEIVFPTGTTSAFTSSSDLSLKTVAFNSDGSLSYSTGGGGLPASLSPNAWATPTQANIGASYWIRLNTLVLSGTTASRNPIFNAAVGGWESLSVQRLFGFVATTTGQTGTTTATINYSIASDSGGINVLGSQSFVIQVSYF
jgi:hypothetical protein